jgi:hypothetical protein
MVSRTQNGYIDNSVVFFCRLSVVFFIECCLSFSREVGSVNLCLGVTTLAILVSIVLFLFLYYYYYLPQLRVFLEKINT